MESLCVSDGQEDALEPISMGLREHKASNTLSPCLLLSSVDSEHHQCAVTGGVRS